MSITEQMLYLSQGQFWIFFGLAVAASLAGFFFAFRNLTRARVIEDIPTARIRSAQQGYVELHGRARQQGDSLVIAPLSGRSCCWFRYRIERRHDKGWRNIESKSSATPFLIADDTGECVIYPEGADVTPGDKQVWHGRSRYPDRGEVQGQRRNPSTLQQVGELLSTPLGIGERYRYSEEYIYPGDEIYTIGLFRSLDEMDHKRSQDQLTRQLLREWKGDQAGLLRDYDRNRDGEIDPQEWETARQNARRLAGELHQEQLRGQTLHSLGATGSRRHPFLISTLPEFDLVRHYRLWARIAIAVFFAGGIGAIMMFTLRF